jgi:hypothetical protein
MTVVRFIGYVACGIAAVLTMGCGAGTSPTPLADQSGCSFDVSPTTLTIDAAGGTTSLQVTTSATGCTWTAAGDVSFIQASPASGIGSSSVSLLIGQNTGTGRSGTAVVAGHTVTVNQSASTSPTPLTGTWSGTWSWIGTGIDGCTYTNGGTLSATLTQTGSSFSGSTIAAGVQSRDPNGCALNSTVTSSGTIFGTVSDTNVVLTLFVNGTEYASQLDGTATLSGNTLAATFPRAGTAGSLGTGSFTLTRK